MIDYLKIEQLNDKIKTHTATTKEKDEYMFLLYQNESINSKMYDKYLKDKNEPDILATAVTIGGIILFGYIITKIAEKVS